MVRKQGLNLLKGAPYANIADESPIRPAGLNTGAIDSDQTHLSMREWR